MTFKNMGFIATVLLGNAVFLSPVLAQSPPASRYEFHERHMGIDVQLLIYGVPEPVANDAATRAFRRIAELNQIFSDYDAESEAMRLCRNTAIGVPVPVSQDLWGVLMSAEQLSRDSNGAFDVTIGPVSKLWRRSRRQAKLPPSELLKSELGRVGWKAVQIDSQHPQVTLHRGDLQLDFGGVVKGYAAEAALKVLKQAGCPQSLVALAGDMAAGDAPEGTAGWPVGIQPLDHPEQRPSVWLNLKNASVSTSGDAFQYVEIEGVRYSHIVNPQTGIGLSCRSSVTVIADHGETADGLATTATILGPQAGLKFVADHGAEAYLVTMEGEQLRTFETRGFRRFVAP